MTFTLPAAVTTTPHTFHNPGRSRKTTYVIDAPDADGKGRAVYLSCSHDGDRKTFTARLQPCKTEAKEGSRFSSETFQIFSGVHIGSAPVARFSAKALDAFTAATIATLAALIASNSQVEALFTDPEASVKTFPRT